MSQRLTGGMLTIGVNGSVHTARLLQQCRRRPDCEPLTIRVVATPPRLPGGMLTTGVNGRGHTSDNYRRLGVCVQTADFLSRFYFYVHNKQGCQSFFLFFTWGQFGSKWDQCDKLVNKQKHATKAAEKPHVCPCTHFAVKAAATFPEPVSQLQKWLVWTGPKKV